MIRYYNISENFYVTSLVYFLNIHIHILNFLQFKNMVLEKVTTKVYAVQFHNNLFGGGECFTLYST